MEKLKNYNSKYEKIKLFFLSFIAIFLLAFSMLYGAFNAYRDYSQELEQNYYNSQIINVKEVEVKKADIVLPFVIEESVGDVYLGSSHNRSFFLNYTSYFNVNSNADLTDVGFDLLIYEYNIGNFTKELIYSGFLSVEFNEGDYDDLPSPVYNSFYEYSFYFVQYQDTGYYSLRCDVYFEDFEPGGGLDGSDEERVYSFNNSTTLLNLNPDLRPFSIDTYVYASSFDYLVKFSSIVVDNAYGIGYSQGFKDGEDKGYKNGFRDGELNGSGGDTTNNAFNYIWSMVSNATNSVLNIFNFNILPGLPLYAVIAVPIIISILFFVLKVVKK